MNRFYIGQKVKVVGSPNPELRCFVGCEGILIGISDVYSDSWFVDIAGNNSCTPDGVRYSFKECRLEPITDSCDLVTWESMRDLWVPCHMREDA